MQVAMSGRMQPAAVGIAVVAAVLFAALWVAGASPAAAGAIAVVLGALVLAAVAVRAWREERERAAALDASAAAERRRRDEELDHLRREVRHLEHAVAGERMILRRVRESLKAEREWSRELRAQLHDLYASRAHRGHSADDVRELILSAAI